MRDLPINGELHNLYTYNGTFLEVVGQTRGTFLSSVRYPYYYNNEGRSYIRFNSFNATYAYDHIVKRHATYYGAVNRTGSLYNYATGGPNHYILYGFGTSYYLNWNYFVVNFGLTQSFFPSGTTYRYNLFTLYNNTNQYLFIDFISGESLTPNEDNISIIIGYKNEFNENYATYYINLSITDSGTITSILYFNTEEPIYILEYDSETIFDVNLPGNFFELAAYYYGSVSFGRMWLDGIGMRPLLIDFRIGYHYGNDYTLLNPTVNTLWMHNVYENISRARGLSGTITIRYFKGVGGYWQTDAATHFVPLPSGYFSSIPPIYTILFEYYKPIDANRYAKMFKDPMSWNLAYNEPTDNVAYITDSGKGAIQCGIVVAGGTSYLMVAVEAFPNFPMRDFITENGGTLTIQWHIFGV